VQVQVYRFKGMRIEEGEARDQEYDIGVKVPEGGKPSHWVHNDAVAFVVSVPYLGYVKTIL
jgi:hypothetical protein